MNHNIMNCKGEVKVNILAGRPTAAYNRLTLVGDELFVLTFSLLFLVFSKRSKCTGY